MPLTEGAPGAGLWLSKDSGRTFRAVAPFPFKNAQRVVFPPGHGNERSGVRWNGDGYGIERHCRLQ